VDLSADTSRPPWFEVETARSVYLPTFYSAGRANAGRIERFAWLVAADFPLLGTRDGLPVRVTGFLLAGLYAPRSEAYSFLGEHVK